MNNANLHCALAYTPECAWKKIADDVSDASNCRTCWKCKAYELTAETM